MTAYEMRISDWSSDVCSSDLMRVYHFVNCEYGLQDIARRRLKVATLADVNDPFEMLSLNLKDSGIRATLGKARKEFGERAEGRRGGKESFSTCRYRWTTDN